MTIVTRTAEQIKLGDEGSRESIKRQFLKSGQSIIVRIPDAQSFVEYYSHAGYYLRSKYKIYSSACTRHTGSKDAYDLAVEVMYTDLKEIEKEQGKNSEAYENLHVVANDLRAKRKMLFGFINLEDGQPYILEVTGGQGDGLVNQIMKNEKKLNKFAFEVSKTGTGTDTMVMLTLLDPDDELEPSQKENWMKTEGSTFDQELFEKTLYVRPEEKKIEDLHIIGFDVTRIGFEAPKVVSDEEAVKQTADLPF